MRYRAGKIGVRDRTQDLSVYLRRVKAGETLEVREREHRFAMLAPPGAKAPALERLIAAGRATPAAGDVLRLGGPWGRRSSRRVSRVLATLRDDSR